MQQQSPVASFLKFTFGFITFIVVSFTLTITVDSYTKKQNAQQAAAAAFAGIVHYDK